MAVNENDALDQSPEDARIAALYRSAAVEEPPERLDRLVQDAARRPFEATVPAPPRAPWWHAWRLPVAFAGVAVLSVSVVMIAQRESAEPLTLPAGPPPASSWDRSAQTQAQKTPAAPATADAVPSQPVNAAPESAAPASKGERAAPAEPAGQAQKRAPAAAASAAADVAEKRGREGDTATPQPFPARDSVERADKSRERASERSDADRPPSRNESLPDQRAAPQRAPDRFEPPAAATSAPKTEAQPPATQPAPAPPAAMIEAKPAPALPPAPSPAPPPPPPAKPVAAPPAAKPMMRTPGEAPAGPPVSTPGGRGLSQEADAFPALIFELEGKPPRQWIERITLLRTQGRRDDADALLREFRRRFPEEPLPPELR